RKAELRLDQREQAVADRGGYRVIVPGKAAASELYKRVTSDDADEHMPPANTGLRLSKREAELLASWIDQGAEYQPHWSFIAPRHPAVPKIKQSAGAANPIDFFVRAELERNGLQPSPPADKQALLRRVTFDLTGLPPTLAEIDAFVADDS